MKILWVLISTLLVCHSRAEDDYPIEKDGAGRQDCVSETCGPSPRPIPMVQREKQPDTGSSDSTSRDQRTYEERFPQGENMTKTNFRCEGKPYIPGFYADMEADCRIFHLCLKSRVEHYRCPHHSVFNQRTLICDHERMVHCHLSPTYYVMNSALHSGHPIVEGTEQFAFNKEADKWLYDMVKDDHNVSDKDILERNLIKTLILMKFVDVTDIVSDVRVEEAILKEAGREGKSRTLSSAELKDMLEHIVRDVFPLLPVEYSYDPITKGQQEETSEPQGVPRSADIKRAADHGRTVQIKFDLPESAAHIALEMMETIVRLVGAIHGKITALSRAKIASNYMGSFLHSFSITRKY